MRQTLIGLAALLAVTSGCTKDDTNDPNSIGINKTVIIPPSCQKVIDVRYQTNGSMQILCENRDGKGATELTLYTKWVDSDPWLAIH